MVFKSVLMLSLFFVPIALLCSGLVNNVYLLFGLYLTAAFGMAGIGMGVMHDAVHGSYSKNKRVNQFMAYSMNLIGGNAGVWKIQHNVLHHNFTNVKGADDDINMPKLLRLSPELDRTRFHRFQFLYVWVFYSLSTISWITAKDFIKTYRFWKMGYVKGGKEFRNTILKIAGWKLLYYSYALVLPLIFIPLSPLLIVLAFLSMHVLTSLIISVIFQTAHIMTNVEFPVPSEDGLIDNEWTVHQMITTTNYAPKSRLFSWLIGGLNYQVEHHLMPNICHIHYRKLSKIVAETAAEFNVPYNVKKTFLAALADHIKMLYQLGKKESNAMKQVLS